MTLVLKNKRISIIGAGRSGLASAKAVRTLGGIPFVSDSNPRAQLSAGQALSELKVEFEFGSHSPKIFECDLLIVSPGVPSDADVIVRAKAKGLTIWPEIELAYRICKGKIIGVTGSNGKTTTTTLIGEILKKGGRRTFVCGNIGNPFVAVAADVPPDGFAVVELSSFQLEMIDEFRPHVAIFLNITPDHLDRHGDFESYMGAKMRIFENQEPDDFAVINHDDMILREKCGRLNARTTWFSVEDRLPEGVWGKPDGDLVARENPVLRSNQLKIRGVHNLSNACAATAAAIDVGIDIDKIAEVLTTFPGVEHRLEPVRLIGGVSFINDSKGTNVDSVHWALLAVSAPVILIAGGKDKAGDFSALNDLISRKVKRVILIGQAAEKIRNTWKDLVECVTVKEMEDAVKLAFDSAIEGDTVLLSPGCASFDMFDNFEHRGRVFKAAVEKLASSGVAR